MRKVLGHLGLRSQLILLLVVVQIAAQVLTFMTVARLADFEGRRNLVAVDLTDGLFSVLSVVKPSGGTEAFDTLIKDDPRFVVTDERPFETPAQLRDIQQLVLAATSAPWRDRLLMFPLDDSVHWAGPPIPPFGVAVRLEGGFWLNFTPNPNTVSQAIPYIFWGLVIGTLALTLAFLGIWAGLALTAPIEKLARGVELFSKDLRAPPIPEEGPREVRRATSAFNLMQQRLVKLIDDRAKTLAAIGHDMRTPLTRLRLRLEDVDAGDATQAIGSDLTTLEGMIDDALRFLRAEGQQVDLARADIAILCQTACDDWSDQGADVTFEGPRNLIAVCDTAAMVRVLNNVIGNAVTYAGRAQVSVCEGPDGGVEITVADTGPGIAPALRAVVLEPFTRLQSVEAGGASAAKGFGFGLTIAHELMTRQGGVLLLNDNVPNGLKVTLRLQYTLS